MNDTALTWTCDLGRPRYALARRKYQL